MIKKIAKKTLAFILVGWAVVSLCALAGEPAKEMGNIEFLLVKIGCLASLVLSVFAIKYFEKIGLIESDEAGKDDYKF